MTPLPAERLPLTGIRVLDLSRILAGPFCTQILGDLGADVVKVERPVTGDDTRRWGPPFVAGQSTYFQSVNRNKRSLALDLNTPAGREVLDDLIRAGDLLVENFLPAEVEKFGLQPERLKSLNPRLVACSISGFGRTGPWSDRPGYDLVIQALSGLMAITGPAAGPPSKVGVAICDVVAGLFAAVSLLAGLAARSTHESAAGRHCDLSLLDCTLASLVNVAQSCLATGAPPGRFGNAHPTIVPYETFDAADAPLLLAVGNDAQFARLCRVLGEPAWPGDPRFSTNPARVAHRQTLVPLIAAHFVRAPLAFWTTLLDAHDVPHAPILTLDAALQLPVVVERHVVGTDDPGDARVIHSPLRFDGRMLPVRRPPPDVGDATPAVLQDWLGYGPERVAELEVAGAFG